MIHTRSSGTQFVRRPSNVGRGLHQSDLNRRHRKPNRRRAIEKVSGKRRTGCTSASARIRACRGVGFARYPPARCVVRHLPWPGVVRRILREWAPSALRQEPQEQAHIFHLRNHFPMRRCWQYERRDRSPDIRVTFIGTDHEGPGFGNGEVAARHARTGSQKPGTRCFLHRPPVRHGRC